MICESAVAYAIAESSVEEINATNILEATLSAMRRAIAALPQKADFALIDGNVSRDFPLPARAVVHGDAISPSIAAASIIAKVTRDRMMVEFAEKYPGYAFEKNKGYGTKAHYKGLDRQGTCPIHRRTFLVKVFEKKNGGKQ